MFSFKEVVEAVVPSVVLAVSIVVKVGCAWPIAMTVYLTVCISIATLLTAKAFDIKNFGLKVTLASSSLVAGLMSPVCGAIYTLFSVFLLTWVERSREVGKRAA